MKARAIFLCWLLLLVPTLIVGALLLRLLSHERERLAQASTSAAAEQARLVADQVTLTVRDLEDGLTDSLRNIPPEELARTLDAWAQKNPLVRNVFVLDEKTGLILPDVGQPLSGELRDFVQRYGTLFSGRVPWASSHEDVANATQGSATSSSYPSPRQDVARWARGASSGQSAGEPTPSGWIPWFWERQLHLLGWVLTPSGRLRYGVELETTSLLSRLVSAMPERVPGGQIIALVDGNGAVVHQRGAAPVEPGARVLSAVPLNSVLPHWQVVVYAGGRLGAAASGRLVFVLMALIAGIFIVAILSGGSLLLWQARRHFADARNKTTFVSNVSHELKTPLTSIRMYAELLEEGRIRDEAKRAHYLDVIVKESQRLTRLVNNVLDFSRLEQGRKRYRPERLDVTADLRRIADNQALRLQEAGMALELRAPGHPCFAVIDRDALEQALLNLIDNAVKYAAAGKRLIVELVQDADRLKIGVCDSGPGVPPAHQKRLFEQFHRVDDSLAARQPGCGLGLSISRRLLRDQGGDLAYAPGPSGGACFIISIPRAKETADEPTTHPGS